MERVFAPVSPTRSPRFRELAFDAIKEAILEGRIEAGAPLIEVKIASALGMSRTPVREALALLSHEGLIAYQSGTGLVIRELSREEFLDMFVANELVEPQLVRRAAVHATELHFSKLQEAIDLGHQAAADADVSSSLRSGREFHRWVGIAADNPPLARFVLRNEEQTDLYLLSLSSKSLLSGEELAISTQEHQDVLDALRRRDPEDASRLVIYHAQSLRRRHKHLFRLRGQESGVRG